MKNSVEDGIGESWVIESGVPRGDRHLGDEHAGDSVVSGVEEFKKKPGIRLGDFVEEPLIEDEKWDASEDGQSLEETSAFDIGVKIGEPEVCALEPDTHAAQDDAVGEDRADKSLPGAGGTGDDDIGA